MSHFLCLYKTGDLDFLLRHNHLKNLILFISIVMIYLTSPFLYCCSFSSHMVNKIVEFCYEKVGSVSKNKLKTYENRRLSAL